MEIWRDQIRQWYEQQAPIQTPRPSDKVDTQSGPACVQQRDRLGMLLSAIGLSERDFDYDTVMVDLERALIMEEAISGPCPLDYDPGWPSEPPV